MGIAKIIEVSAVSPESFEAAIRDGLARVAQTVHGIQGAWVSEMKVRTSPAGQVEEFRVCMRVSFVVD